MICLPVRLEFFKAVFAGKSVNTSDKNLENDYLPMRHLINFMQWKIAGKEEEHEFFKKESIC